MKIGFFITARLKSSRLKQKILLDLNGKSVIDRVIERVKKVKGIDGVVLCTSNNPQDSVLYDNALSNQIQFFAGSEEDVLKRLLDAAEFYGYDAFVSITADNPLFSIHTSTLLVDMYKKNGYDFINTKGLPIGCGTYLLDVKALKVVNYMKEQSNTEIWGPFINRPDFFNVADLVVVNSPFDEKLRITLDYPEDYSFIRSIYKEFNPKSVPNIQDVFQTFSDRPELLNINDKHIQIMPEDIELINIKNYFNSKKNSAIEYANSINKKLIASLTIENVVI